MIAETIKNLSKKLDDKHVQHKPGRGNSGRLAYISHGSITEALNEHAPGWSTEAIRYEIHEIKDRNGNIAPHCLAVTLAMSIEGVTRVETGCPANLGTLGDDMKNAHSDALKRCAMRFGLGLYLWEELVDTQDDEDYGNTTSDANQGVVTRHKSEGGTSTHNAPQTQRGATQNQSQRDDPVESSLASGAATQRQLRYLQAVAREAGYGAAGLDALSQKEFGVPIAVLSRSDATNLIDFIQNDSLKPPPQPKAEANGQPMKTSSKQDPDDPNSVLPTKRREDMLKAIFEHTRGQITATDLNNLQQETIGTPLTRITIQQSRDLYTRILNMNEHERTSIRDDLRRKYQPLTETLMKKLWAVVGKHTPAGVEKDNYLHVQLFEHLGLGSVKDMSTYDVDKMISVYEGQDFLDPAPVGEGDEQVTWD